MLYFSEAHLVSPPTPQKTGRTCKYPSILFNHTYFDRESRRKVQFDKISQSCKMSAGSSHEVNDRNDLLHKGEWELFAHPQRSFKSAGFDRVSAGVGERQVTATQH